MMFESKDASKGDERQVKNTPKRLTQKSKGEIYTMGNRGIQLSVFFVIGLMLIAGLFANAAIAAKNDAKGEVEVEWVDGGAAATSLPPFAEATGTPVTADDSPTGDSSHLNAASKWNMLQFTYTAWNDDNDDDQVDAGDDTAINMAGGRVRITFPGGWKVSKKSVRVEESYDDNGTAAYRLLYGTNAAGDVLDGGGGRTTVGTSASRARVSFTADKNITVSLDNGWVSARDLVNKELVITLADVQAGIPRVLDKAGATADVAATSSTYQDNHAEVPFEASSSARNGTLVLLTAGSPSVRVGSIVGIGDAATTRDTVERKLVVTPKRVFSEEKNHSFNMVFKANGPMYGSQLAITIPTALAKGTTEEATSRTLVLADFNITTRGGGLLGTDTGNPALAVTDQVLTIPINKIDVGQEIVVSYRFEGEEAIGLLVGTPAATDSAISATTVTGTTTTANAVKPDGGVAFPEAGSGSVSLVPNAVEQGSLRRNIGVTYTAYTDLENTTITITTKGLVIDAAADPAQKLQKDDSAGYGYVFGDMIDNVTITAGDTIEWGGIDLKANKSVKLTIKQVNISKMADEYAWDVMVRGTTATGAETDVVLRDDKYADADGDGAAGDVDENPILSVLQTSRGNVTFEIVGDTTLPALSMQTITFKFTADKTTIRDGWVSFTIPAALGSAPTITDKTAGGVDVAIAGGRKANKYRDSLVSGRTIKVNVKRLDVSGTVTVTYGNDKPAVLHHEAGKITIPGTFRTSREFGDPNLRGRRNHLGQRRRRKG